MTGRGGISDRVLGAACIALAAFFIWAATSIELSFISDPVGPRVFPIIIGIVVGLCGIIILLRPDPEPDWPALPRLLEIMAAVLVLAAYAQALPELGFVFSTAVASAYLSWRLGSKPLEAVIAGIGIAVAIYIVFHLILGLSLARGPWGF